MKRILFTHFHYKDYLEYKTALQQISSEFAISHIECGDELFNLLRFFTPDILFIDLSLKNNDANTCLCRLRSEQLFRSLKIIIHSTSPNPDLVNISQLSANFYLMAKPFSVDQLRKTVENALYIDSNAVTFASDKMYASR